MLDMFYLRSSWLIMLVLKLLVGESVSWQKMYVEAFRV